MTSPTGLRWGIAGTGNIATKFAEGLHLVPGAVLVAVASHDADRAATFARAHGAERHHVGYEALAADDGVDIVYVPSPHSGHHDDTLLFLGSGRHVLCEKPLAVNARQAAAMIEAARAADRFLMEAVWSRFLPAYVTLRELLADGAIGEPELVEAEFGFQAPFDPHHRLFDPALGGGSVLDLGIYPLQLATTVLGPVAGVVAAGRTGATGVDETALAIVTHAGGGHSSLTSSLRMTMAGTARVIGANGAIDLPAPMHHPDHLTVTVGTTSRRIDTPYDGNGLHYQAIAVQECVASGALESDVMPWDASLDLARAMDAIRAAIGVRYDVDE